MRLKDTHSPHPVLHFIMTFEIASALLNRANTGSDLLQILDSIAADQEAGTVTDTDGTPIIW
jgi:hypothetical protein